MGSNKKPGKEKPADKPAPKKEPETPKKPDIIKEKLNDIKNLAIAFVNQCKSKEKFAPAEALKLTNTILKSHKVFENAQKKKVVLPKKVCKELKNNPPEGVRSVEKLANEKPHKINFEKPIPPPLPAKKEGEAPMKKTEEEDEAKKGAEKGELKMPIDEKTRYTDDSDLFKIDPFPYSDKPRMIIVPRTIPKEFVPKDKPPKKKEPGPQDKLPDSTLNDEDPVPIFPMDDNPGDIKQEDLQRVKKIAKDPHIPVTKEQCEKDKKKKEEEKKKKAEEEKKKKDGDKNKKDDDKKKKDDEKKKKEEEKNKKDVDELKKKNDEIEKKKKEEEKKKKEEEKKEDEEEKKKKEQKKKKKKKKKKS